MVMNPLFSRFPVKRRTARLSVQQTIAVAGQDRDGKQFSLSGKATNLNHFGGAITVPKQLPVGTTLTLRNNHKMEAAVKVVGQVKVLGGMHSYGVQFVDDASGFWGITFPPAR